MERLITTLQLTATSWSRTPAGAASPHWGDLTSTRSLRVADAPARICHGHSDTVTVVELLSLPAVLVTVTEIVLLPAVLKVVV